MDTAASAWDFAQPGALRASGSPSGEPLFYEDLIPGRVWVSEPHVVDRAELVGFARIWDPLPFHIDEHAGQQAFGGITAPGLYMLAIKQRLIHTLPPHQIVASFGYDEVRFHLPLRPEDRVYLKEECLDRQESRSKSDRGIATLRFALINQRAEVVMSHLDKILVRRRSASLG